MALFSTGRCAHHGCNMSLIFHLLHTRIILFFCFININMIWELLILDTILVCIVNSFWRCIHFHNISMKILVPCWHDHLPLFICHIISFIMQIDSNFLIALKRNRNPARQGFEVIKPQAFCKIQVFIFRKDPPYSTLVLGILRSKYWIGFFSIFTYLRLRPRITAFASNLPLSKCTIKCPKYCSLLFVSLKKVAQWLELRKEILFILIS